MSADARALDPKELFYDSIAGVWDAKMDAAEIGKRLRLVFGRLLRPQDVRGRKTLDAGCGTGRFSRVLADWGADLVSSDIGGSLTTMAASGIRSRGVRADITRLPFASRAFAAVLSTEVVEHTPDPRAAVRELCRVVAPGGVLALTTPNKLWHPAIVAATTLRLRPYHGLENWTSYHELRSWLIEEGLEIEDYFGFNLLPHTFFCRPAFDRLDAPRALHPFMINIAARALRPA